jgi:nucleotide-binding universal stress UspA family protein
MIELRRILCPVDFSPLSRRALEHATALARWYEADVTALYVHPFAVGAVAELPYLPPPRAMSSTERQQLMAQMRALVAPAREAGVVVEVKLLEGGPAPAIELEAQERDVDLIVMGTHGRHGLERLLLGSVAESVVRRAPCPVLTVGPTAEGAPPVAAFRRILCPVDLLDRSADTARIALSLAQEAGAQVWLLHVLDGRSYPAAHAPFGINLEQYRADVENISRHQLRRLLPPNVRDWCQPDVEVSWGNPGQEVLAAAEQHRADLVVMGAHGGAMASALFGSTAERVVRAAACPVLTVRDRARRPRETTRELAGATSGGGPGETR